MDNIELAELIVTPENPWWPLALGWWLVIAIVLLSMIALIIVVKRLHKQRQIQRRKALWLARFQQIFNAEQASSLTLSQLAELVLSAYNKKKLSDASPLFSSTYSTIFEHRYNNKPVSAEQQKQANDWVLHLLMEAKPWN